MAHVRPIRMERVEQVACRFCKMRTQHEVYTNRMHCVRCGKTTYFDRPAPEVSDGKGTADHPGNPVV